jgi:hypothetical protein
MAINLQDIRREVSRIGSANGVLALNQKLKINITGEEGKLLDFTADKDYDFYIYVRLEEKQNGKNGAEIVPQ